MSPSKSTKINIPPTPKNHVSIIVHGYQMHITFFNVTFVEVITSGERRALDQGLIEERMMNVADNRLERRTLSL